MRTYLFPLLLCCACSNSASTTSAPNTKSPADGANVMGASDSPAAPTPKPTKGELITTASGLKYKVLRAGGEEKPIIGQRVSVHYTGRFEDGKVFDSSVLQQRPPLVFPVGTRRVIKGWDEALLGMGLGEKRLLTIPPHLAYGAEGHPGGIPPNATLIFEIELVGLLEKPGQFKAPQKTQTAPSSKP
jgi:FKBP-type peptidyl-prolyl cis-trans isomerase